VSNLSRSLRTLLDNDSDLLGALLKHLDPLVQSGFIACWYADRIAPGDDREQILDEYRHNADIILLLMSSDFVASEICCHIDMRVAMERFSQEKLSVIPVLLRPVAWKELPCGKFQCLPTNARPVTLWQNMDAAFSNIVQGVKSVLSHLGASSQAGEASRTSPTWNVPYRRNPFFTGREELLALLYRTFHSDEAEAQEQVLTGLAGVGKTQLAIEYAYRFSERYQAILWIRADSQEDMLSDFVALADVLDLSEKDESNQQRVMRAIKRWLQTHTKWLLVLDNVENVNLIHDLLPLVHQGHVLITTRSDATGPFVHALTVQKMEPAEGALLLLRRSKFLPL